MTEQLKTVALDPEWWACGPKYNDSEDGGQQNYLAHKDGMMCCLGFASLALGAKMADLVGKGLPDEIPVIGAAFLDLGCTSDILSECATINDDPEDMPYETRVKLLNEALEAGKAQLRFTLG